MTCVHSPLVNANWLPPAGPLARVVSFLFLRRVCGAPRTARGLLLCWPFWSMHSYKYKQREAHALRVLDAGRWPNVPSTDSLSSISRPPAPALSTAGTNPTCHGPWHADILLAFPYLFFRSPHSVFSSSTLVVLASLGLFRATRGPKYQMLLAVVVAASPSLLFTAFLVNEAGGRLFLPHEHSFLAQHVAQCS